MVALLNRTKLTDESRIVGGLFGLVVGDAVGVPVQFWSRERVRENPITGMDRAESPKRPPGYWSDDSSMTIATASSLIDGGWKPRDLMDRFARWLLHGEYTPEGEAWDEGGTTAHAITRYVEGVPLEEAGGRDEHEAHERSQLCCAIYSLVVREAMRGADIERALKAAADVVDPFVSRSERKILKSILSGDVLRYREKDIESTGYVVHTLGAALWCCARHENYRSAVLEAVNLGDDADTTGAVAGGLAGVLHGADAIPQEWFQALEKPNVVWHLAHRFAEAALGRGSGD